MIMINICMTYSIIARDPQSGALGAAAATGNLAVGGWVLHLRAGVGAVATQGFSTNTLYGVDGLDLLRGGAAPAAVCDRLTGQDDGRDYRQLLVVGLAGTTAGWTGASNTDYKAHVTHDDLALAGNWLHGPDVLLEMEHAYRETQATFADRLLAAIAAGYGAGGDTRGTMSASLKVYGTTCAPLDLRIDCAEQPIVQLRALYARTLDPEYQEFFQRSPTMANPASV